MIENVDRSLRKLLASELVGVQGAIMLSDRQITFDPPSQLETAPGVVPRLNLFLFDIRENVSRREYGFVRTRKDATAAVESRRSATSLTLSYLVTVYAGGDFVSEHRLLTDAFATLMRHACIPAEHRVVSPGEEPLGEIVLSVGQPEHALTADPSSLWQGLGASIRPAIGLQVEMPFDPYLVRMAPPVREVAFDLHLSDTPEAPEVDDEIPSELPEAPAQNFAGKEGLQSGRNEPADINPANSAIESAGQAPDMGTAAAASGSASVFVSVFGRVLDQGTDAPLSGVRVLCDEQGRETRTASDGTYVFANLPDGTLALRFVRSGYKAQTQEITVVRERSQSGFPAPVIVRLTKKPLMRPAHRSK